MRISYSGKSRLPASARIALFGILLALSLIFSYLELLIPSLPIPGCKLGLANLLITFCAYFIGLREALLLSILRVFLSSLLFGTFTGFFYALGGALFAFSALTLLLRCFSAFVSPLGVSVACAAAHNVGQLCAAVLLLSMHGTDTIYGIFSYLPYLLVMGTIMGTLTGLLLCSLFRALCGIGYIPLYDDTNPEIHP